MRLKLDHAHISWDRSILFLSARFCLFFLAADCVYKLFWYLRGAGIWSPRIGWVWLSAWFQQHNKETCREPSFTQEKKKKKHAFFPQCAGIYSDLFVQLKSLWFVNYFTCSSLEGSDIIIVCVRRVFLLINFGFEEVEIDLLFCCSGTSTERTPPCRMPRQNSVSFFFFFFLSALLDHQTVYHLLRRSKSWNFAHEFAYFFARLSN